MRKKVIFPALFLILTTIVMFSIPNFAFAVPPPGHTPIYVNGATGDDINYDGTSPTYISGHIGPKKTISAGIAFVLSGGIVYVAAGNYDEGSPILISRSLTLQGEGSSDTIINGGSTHRVLQIDPVSTVNVNINDFKITKGTAVQGAGIFIDNSATGNVLITDCKITDNTADTGGGGIYQGGSAKTTISNSTISNNHAATNGGGIEIDAGSFSINNCIISNNSAGGSGGGIWNNGDTCSINNCIITNNSDGIIGGGGIFNSSDNCSIHFSTIANNTAANGAGIFDSTIDSDVRAENNWWGSSSGPSGGIPDAGNPNRFANGDGNEIFGHVYFYPWLHSDPFAHKSKEKAKAKAKAVEPVAPVVEPVWVRTGPMVCANVWVNQKGDFQFVFWYPYRDNNWVRIYDASGKEVFSIDMPLDNPQFEVSLPDGTYTVKTFTVGSTDPIQTFVIGKDANTPHQNLGDLSK